MEDFFRAPLSSISLPAEQQEMYTAAVSDFANSGELGKILTQIFQTLRQAGIGESNSFLQEVSAAAFDTFAPDSVTESKYTMKQLQETAMPAFAESLLANRSLAPIAQTTPAQCLPEPSANSPLPEQTVLFEACTINQPMNAALRDKHSTGTYYFLTDPTA